MKRYEILDLPQGISSEGHVDQVVDRFHGQQTFDHVVSDPKGDDRLNDQGIQEQQTDGKSRSPDEHADQQGKYQVYGQFKEIGRHESGILYQGMKTKVRCADESRDQGDKEQKDRGSSGHDEDQSPIWTG